MSNVTSVVETHLMTDQGSMCQCVVDSNTLGIAASVPSNDDVDSNVIRNNGYKYFSFGCQSTQAGSVSIQRYIDSAGTIAIGSAITGNFSSNVVAIDSVDNIPYQSLIITVNNSAGSAATLSNVILLLQAN